MTNECKVIPGGYWIHNGTKLVRRYIAYSNDDIAFGEMLNEYDPNPVSMLFSINIKDGKINIAKEILKNKLINIIYEDHVILKDLIKNIKGIDVSYGTRGVYCKFGVDFERIFFVEGDDVSFCINSVFDISQENDLRFHFVRFKNKVIEFAKTIKLMDKDINKLSYLWDIIFNGSSNIVLNKSNLITLRRIITKFDLNIYKTQLHETDSSDAYFEKIVNSLNKLKNLSSKININMDLDELNKKNLNRLIEIRDYQFYIMNKVIDISDESRKARRTKLYAYLKALGINDVVRLELEKLILIHS